MRHNQIQKSVIFFNFRAYLPPKTIMNLAVVGVASPLEHRPPIRILHVVGMMNRGGAETWLMHILRNIDRDKFKIDFLVGTTDSCAYDAEILALGSRIIPCLGAANPWQYARNFKQVLAEYGPYDVVHSHIHHYSGYILRLAKQAGVTIRICHSHIDSSPLEAKASWWRRAYLKLMQGWIDRYATIGLGCSDIACADLFGANWRKDPRWQSYYYGIDLAPFAEAVDPASIRQELGIPDNSFVIGHVGRFHEQKNHPFLLEIFAQVLKQAPQAYLLLVGEGALRPQIEQQISQMNLTERVIFAGSRADVARLMLGAMDVFVMPSLCEGLPLVGIEVQSAGLPAALSEAITEEVCIVKQLVTRLSLSAPVSIWADTILHAHQNRSIGKVEALDIVRRSPFNIQVGVAGMSKILSQLTADRFATS
jgi:glycosyltransferase involved in cell wall biosynthesis